MTLKLRHLGHKTPGASGSGERVRQLWVLAANAAGEADVRGVLSSGHADVGVGGDQRLYGCADVLTESKRASLSLRTSDRLS